MNDMIITTIFSCIISLAYTLVNLKLINKKKYFENRKLLNDYNCRLKKIKKNSILYYQLKKEKSLLQVEVIKLQFKPTLVMLIPMIITLSWLSLLVKQWIWTYIITSIIWGYIWRKLFKKI